MSDDFSTLHPSMPDVACALTGAALIQALSMACQGKIDVNMPTRQMRPVSQNWLVITNSGERKSTVDSILQKQLQDANKKHGDL